MPDTAAICPRGGYFFVQLKIFPQLALPIREIAFTLIKIYDIMAENR